MGSSIKIVANNVADGAKKVTTNVKNSVDNIFFSKKQKERDAMELDQRKKLISQIKVILHFFQMEGENHRDAEKLLDELDLNPDNEDLANIADKKVKEVCAWKRLIGEESNDLVNLLANENPYVKPLVGRDNIPISVKETKDMPGVNGSTITDVGDKTGDSTRIQIRHRITVDHYSEFSQAGILGRKTPGLAELFRTVGHEISHANMKKIYAEAIQKKEKGKKINDALTSDVDVKKEDTDAFNNEVSISTDGGPGYWNEDIVQVLIETLGEKLPQFQEFQSLSQEEQDKVKCDIANAQYYGLITEKIAQFQGYNFAHHMLKSLIEDELVSGDEELLNYLRHELTDLELMTCNDPFLNNNKGGEYEISLNSIETALLEELNNNFATVYGEVERSSNEKNKLLDDRINDVAADLSLSTEETIQRVSELKKRQMTLANAKDLVMRFYSKNTSKENFEAMIIGSLGSVDETTMKDLTSTYKSRIDVDKKESKNLDNKIIKMLSENDLPANAYSSNLKGKDIFVNKTDPKTNKTTNAKEHQPGIVDDESMVDDMILGLLKNGQLLKASLLCSNNKKSPKVATAFNNVYKDIVDKINKGDKVSRVEYDMVSNSVISSFVELGDKKLEEKFFANVVKMPNLQQVNFMTDEEEIEYYRNNNGEQLIPYIKEKQEEKIAQEKARQQQLQDRQNAQKNQTNNQAQNKAEETDEMGEE